MKFLFVLKDRPGSFSGPIVNLRRLLPALNAKGHEAVLILETHGDHSPHVDHFKEQGVQVYHFLLQKGHDPKPYVIEYLKVVQELAPDLFVPNLSEIAALAARWVSKAGIPSVVSVRRDERYNLAFAKKFALKKGYWGNCELHCVAGYLAEKCRSLADRPTHQRVIPSGSVLPEKVKASYYGEERGNDILRIVYSGRVVQPQKRVLDLIGILAHIVKRHPGKVEVSIIGDGPLKKRVRELLERKGVEEAFRFYSKIYGDAYYELLKEHDVQVLFSDFEGLPGSVMDAMGCGLVPVVTSFKGSDELVNHRLNGFRLKSRRELIPLVRNLLTHPEQLRPMGEASRELAKKQFSIDRNVEDWVSFGDELEKAYPEKDVLSFPEGNEWEQLEFPALPRVRLKKAALGKIKEKIETRWNIDFPGFL